MFVLCLACIIYHDCFRVYPCCSKYQSFIPFFFPQSQFPLLNVHFSRTRVLFLLRWAFLIARLVKNPPACRRRWSNSWIGKIRWRRNRHPLQHSWTSLVAQLVKNPPVMWEIWVRSLGWEDASEKGKATHSSMLA